MPTTNLGRVAIVPQGAYDEATEYKKLDLVTDGGSSYLYTSDTPGTGVPLTDTSHWQQIAEKGDTGQTAFEYAVAGGFGGSEAEFETMMSSINEYVETAEDSATTAVAKASEAEGYAALLSAGVSTPFGVFADLAALNTADPDHTKIYLTSNNGNWNYWNGTAFVAGGVYQATTPLAFSVDPADAGLNITYTY